MSDESLRTAASDLLAAMHDGFMGAADYYMGPNARTSTDPTRYNRVHVAMKRLDVALSESTESLEEWRDHIPSGGEGMDG